MERQAVGVVECAEDDPNGFMSALFGEDFIEKDETFLSYTFRSYSRVRVFQDGFFDVFDVLFSKRLAEAFCLELMDLFITPVAVLVSVAKIKYSLKCRHTS